MFELTFLINLQIAMTFVSQLAQPMFIALHFGRLLRLNHLFDGLDVRNLNDPLLNLYLDLAS